MIWLAVFIFAFTLIRFLVLLSNLVFRPWVRSGKTQVSGRVSVLIPARNEESTIGNLLGDLQNSTPDKLIHEILVYDDLSEDRTAERVNDFSKKDERIRLITGTGLPDGWKGKNHACHQLSVQATGDWYLFMDADVRVQPDALSKAVQMAEQKKLSLLSVFPYQIMLSPGEWMIVPLMNWILLSLLPLTLVRTCKWTSFSAANGQFMLFRSSIYDRYQWHREVRNDPVEDILISRLMKKRKFKMATLIGRGEISCRMYPDFGSALTGFAKNFGQFFGNSRLWMILFGILSSAGIILIPFFLSGMAAVGYYLLLLAMRILVALITRQPVLKTILLALPQHLVMLRLMGASLAYRRGKTLMWKGRPI